jgi:hypothetical protein
MCGLKLEKQKPSRSYVTGISTSSALFHVYRRRHHFEPGWTSLLRPLRLTTFLNKVRTVPTARLVRYRHVDCFFCLHAGSAEGQVQVGELAGIVDDRRPDLANQN